VAGGPARLALSLFPGAAGLAGMKRRTALHHDGEVLPSRGPAIICELCHRQVDGYTVHHLVPRARGGRFGPKANLCPTCHRQVHALFSETTLAQELHSIELLRANPQVAAYLKWVRKQKGGAGFRVRRANERR
jgi:5-methylcytosine-specific restriction enzyme A